VTLSSQSLEIVQSEGNMKNLEAKLGLFKENIEDVNTLKRETKRG